MDAFDNVVQLSEKTGLVYSARQGLHEEKSEAKENFFPNVIENAFLKGRRQWIDEPIIAQWAPPTPEISKTLREVNNLYHQWSNSVPGPLYPFFDPLWLQTCNLLRDVGLPWHNNNLNLPNEIDPSWPFHFKDFERQVVLSKGIRVGDDKASGYICAWSEGNQYAIRALQQELRRQIPTQRPLLVGNHIESGILESSAQLFGLELYQIEDDWEKAVKELLQRSKGRRPIIFAATISNARGQSDDFAAIGRLSWLLPVFLHVDASRTFDFVTTLSESTKRKLGIPRLKLRHPYLDCSSARPVEDDIIFAATIVAAGMNCTSPPPVVVLKPHMLGNAFSGVEYVRGTDGTLGGSRDALGPLLLWLQEVRFSVLGIREIYSRCMQNRRILCDLLLKSKIAIEIPPASLDIIIRPPHVPKSSLQQKWGLVSLMDGAFLITMQPSVTSIHIQGLITLLSTERCEPVVTSFSPVNGSNYFVSSEILRHLREVVAGWRISAKFSGGYPLNQAPYSALGPVIGHFLPLTVPPEWADLQGGKILKDRMRSFGLTDAEYGSFTATFTTGGTMSNRVGLHTALANLPNGFIYFSSATHYSVKKIVLDSDNLTGRWDSHKKSRFAEIPADELGRMIPDKLVEQVQFDKAFINSHGQKHDIILLANMGTTFVGGYDDIIALRQALRAVGSDIAYIHIDGALDFGFSSDTVRLGAPNITEKNGLPVVQGITLSHHKAYGIMVSGEAICFRPVNHQLKAVVSSVEPRVIFETWLFQRIYTPVDLVRIKKYCRDNADLLRSMLHAKGVVTRFNRKSFITLLERVPPWLMQEFHLAPEGDWVHYITMPHISPSAVAHFVDTITLPDMHFATAFRSISSRMNARFGCTITLLRIRCLDQLLFPKVLAFVKTFDEEKTFFDEGLQAFSLDKFKRQYVYGAMSFVALSADNDDPVAVFLVGATAHKTVWLGPVLTRTDIDVAGSDHSLEKLALEALLLVSQNLEVTTIQR